MEPRRHVDCGHCLDMEQGHSSLVPLVRFAFRARLSCPGHLVTAFHGFTMLYEQTIINICYKPVILRRPIHEKKNTFPKCHQNRLTAAKIHFDRTHTLETRHNETGKVCLTRALSVQVAVVLLCLQIVDGFTEPFHLMDGSSAKNY